MSISVKTTCVRIKLTIGKQSAYITDKQLTDGVESSFNTHGRAKVIKRAFKNCKEHKDIQSRAGDVYQYYINNTLPWDAAYRVVPAKVLFDTLNGINERIIKANEAVDKFLDNYDNHVQKDITESGGMMKYEDYPSSEEFKNKFYFKTDLAPVSDAEDFRNIEGLDEQEIEQIKENAKENERTTIMASIKEARNRLYKVVLHMQERLQQYTGAEGERLHKSVLTNVEDCIAILRKLNITNDSELNDVMDELESYVVGKDIERLMVFPHERREIVDKVKELSDKWHGWVVSNEQTAREGCS